MSAGRIESEEWFDMLVDFLRRGCMNDGGLHVEIFSGFDAHGEPKLKSQPKLTLTISTWWWLIRSEVVPYYHVREPLSSIRLDQLRQAIPSGFWALLYVLDFTVAYFRATFLSSFILRSRNLRGTVAPLL